MTRARDTADTQDNVGGSVPPFAAGKNKIINGDFNINQRAFSSSTVGDVFTFDRWNKQSGGTEGTVTVSAQTFTPGTAPVSGYEGANFIRNVTSGATSSNTYSQIRQFIEDVRTFANQTVTVSFWAKASSGTPKVALEVRQNFGSGGSPSSLVQTAAGSATISTSWARYSITFTVPSISGKTIGTTANTSYLGLILWLSAGSDYNSLTGSIGIQNNTIDIWGVQLEAGRVATPFQTATGTIQGELAACQRYFINFTGTTATPAMGAASTTTVNRIPFPMPVSMRSTPSASYTGTPQVYDGVTLTNINGIGSVFQDENLVTLDMSVASGLTQYRPYQCYLNNGTINFSSEL